MLELIYNLNQCPGQLLGYRLRPVVKESYKTRHWDSKIEFIPPFPYSPPPFSISLALAFSQCSQGVLIWITNYCPLPPLFPGGSLPDGGSQAPIAGAWHQWFTSLDATLDIKVRHDPHSNGSKSQKHTKNKGRPLLPSGYQVPKVKFH